MRSACAGAAFLALLAMANVVGAGVFAVLGPIALEIEEPGLQTGAMVLVMVLSAGAAFLFLKGSLREIIDHLQCQRGRRGG